MIITNMKEKNIGLLHRHLRDIYCVTAVTQTSPREGTGNKQELQHGGSLTRFDKYKRNFRQLINKMSFVCVKEGEDSLMCNGTRYDLHEGELSYKDTLFWVYLGVYVALVLLAGEDSDLLYCILTTEICYFYECGNERKIEPQ